MAECWLKPNRRALTVGMVLPITMGVVGCVLLLHSGWSPVGGGAAAVGGGLTISGLIVMIGLVWHLLAPRIGYRRGEVLFFLRAAGPIAVPLDVVEGFLLGQAPGRLAGRGRQLKTATVTVRLAETARPWHDRDVNPALATWRDGYISILGTWCEPLSVDQVQMLNRKLARAKKSVRDPAVGPAANDA